MVKCESVCQEENIMPGKNIKENIDYLSKYVRDYIKKLGEKLNEKEE